MRDMRIRKEDMFNLGNVLTTTSDLKTAKLNQSRKQLLQDQANMENEAYGNFLAKDKPNSMVQPIDANQDGKIDDNERRTAVRQTGMQMNAFNQIENLGNKRENRQIAASNRARVANDRAQKKSTQAELTSMLTDSLTKAGVDKDTIKMIALGGSKEVKQLNAAMKTMEAKEKAQIKDQVEKQGNILGYVAKATSGKSTQEQNAVMETMLSQVNPKERPHTKKLMTDKDGNYSHAITFANMALLGNIGDDDGQSANSKAVDRRQKRTLNASKQKEAQKQENARSDKAYELAKTGSVVKSKYGKDTVDTDLYSDYTEEIDKVLNSNKKIRPATAYSIAKKRVDKRKKEKEKNPTKGKRLGTTKHKDGVYDHGDTKIVVENGIYYEVK